MFIDSIKKSVIKKCILLSILGFGGLAFLCAQTHAEMENLLESPNVTYAQAARFVLEASDAAVISDTREAFLFALERKWLPAEASPDSPARLDGISLLLMRSFSIKGGIFYSLFRNPHFAYRELVYLNIIQGRTDPRMAVSGSQLLFIVGRTLTVLDRDNT